MVLFESDLTRFSAEYIKRLIVFVFPDLNDMDRFWPGVVVPEEQRDASMPEVAPGKTLVRMFQEFGL